MSLVCCTTLTFIQGSSEWATVETKPKKTNTSLQQQRVAPRRSLANHDGVVKRSSSSGAPQPPQRTASSQQSNLPPKQQPQLPKINQSHVHANANNSRTRGHERSKSFTVTRNNSNASQQSSNDSQAGTRTSRRASYTPQNSNKGLGKNNANVTLPAKTKGNKTPARSQSFSGGGKNNSSGKNNHSISPHRPRLLQEICLLSSTGSGESAEQQQIVRFSADLLLSRRMLYTDAPAPDSGISWTPHDRCWWQAPDRLQKIEQEQSLYYNFKPLQINDETRWKPKLLAGGATDIPSDAAILASTTGILNKLSWTNIDKLTLKFLEALGVGGSEETTISQELIHRTMQIVVEKAMLEPHFAELYARLSVKLSAIHKAFKRSVLQLCQEQFEITDSEEVNNENESAADRETANILARKKSIGLMKFIGELFVMKLIKAQVMLTCCKRLLNPQDEEKLESFCKLMTTIGKRLHSPDEQQGCEADCAQLWDQVYSLAGKKEGGPVAPSTRIKFLLQALVELKENNWIQLRHEHEKAKTIAQIHKEVARDAKRGPVTKTASAVLKRSQSGDGLGLAPSGNINKSSNPVTAETQGFVPVALPSKPKRNSLRRVKSDLPTASTRVSSLQRAAAEISLADKPAKSQPLSSFTEHLLDPTACGDKTRTILKEYFVSGDRDEAVLLIDEMVGMGTEGHVERGAAIVQAGILLVMEMKEVEVRKFLAVVSKCLDDQKLDKASLVPALNDPLEFLRDIEIDAPLAANLLAIVIADWLKKKVDDGETALQSIECLLNAPKYFLTDGRPAVFAALILRQRGGDIMTEVEVSVVTELMCDDEKEACASTTDFLQVHMSK